MLKTSKNIKLKVKKEYSNFESLMNDTLKNKKKFTYEIISDQYVMIKVNPLYRSFRIHNSNLGRFIQAKITRDSLNNLNPIIEIEEETISNTFAISAAAIVICIVFYCHLNNAYFMALVLIGVTILLITTLHILNIHGIACFTSELIDEIEK